MALPVLNTPTYELTVPSTGETLKYRPFLVKEQKVLMIAQEAGNEKQILGAIGDIIESCTFGELKSIKREVIRIMANKVAKEYEELFGV